MAVKPIKQCKVIKLGKCRVNIMILKYSKI